jgi:hypothetical protein
MARRSTPIVIRADTLGVSPTGEVVAAIFKGMGALVASRLGCRTTAAFGQKRTVANGSVPLVRAFCSSGD